MSNWQKFKKWFVDTLSFTYIKGLINDHTNDNLKEFIGTVLAGQLVILNFYAVYKAKTDNAILDVIFYNMMFICVLFGIEGVVRFLTKSSDNAKEKDIEVAKCQHTNKPIKNEETEYPEESID